MRKYLTAGVALLVLQLLLVFAYLALDEDDERTSATPDAEPPRRISSELPELALRYADGTAGNLSAYRGRPFLLHFWATWCPPCRTELPGLLELAKQGDLEVLVVGLDSEWGAVERFLAGPVPPYMALANGSQVEARFGVHELPQSFVVDRAGRLTLQFHGARDWTAASTLRLLPVDMR